MHISDNPPKVERQSQEHEYEKTVYPDKDVNINYLVR